LVQGLAVNSHFVGHIGLGEIEFGQTNQEPSAFCFQFRGTASGRPDALDPVVDGDELFPQALITHAARTEPLAESELRGDELFRRLLAAACRAIPGCGPTGLLSRLTK
jgi:hypothetical protein